MDRHQVKLKQAITEAQKDFYSCPSASNYTKLTDLLMAYQEHTEHLRKIDDSYAKFLKDRAKK